MKNVGELQQFAIKSYLSALELCRKVFTDADDFASMLYETTTPSQDDFIVDLAVSESYLNDTKASLEGYIVALDDNYELANALIKLEGDKVGAIRAILNCE